MKCTMVTMTAVSAPDSSAFRCGGFCPRLFFQRLVRASLLGAATLLCLTAMLHGVVMAASGGIQVRGGAKAEPALDVMIGSMLMLGFRGSELAPGNPFLEEVRAGHVGHVILFDRDVTTGGDRNIISPDQVRRLTASLRAVSPGPLLVAVDQEGGRVRRLKPQRGFMDLPSAQSMGRLSPQQTRVVAGRLGDELASLGISVNLAPVADVNSNPANPAIGALERSFSPDPVSVAAHALAFGQGLAEKGVIPALKHFPGQGGARKDSHLGLTDITNCWNARVDLAPYAHAFSHAWPGMVMMGHVFHQGLDSQFPATLSRAVVTGLLRNKLGWQGVVISDDMQMKAITTHYGMEQAMLLAVNAGVDILLFGNNLSWDEDLPRKAFAALRNLVESGRISRQRIVESWRRITGLYAAEAALAAQAGSAGTAGAASLYPWPR